ncbi:hypothetical protein ABEF93_001403 [Exophiala dermatitidis]
MPLNTLRLNHQKSTHPNDRIVFIKPLPRPSSDRTSYDLADTFLRAIAAQCLPIMKNHFLSITTLEEHEPNREFIGRNFNNGEVIQLVLRNSHNQWLPFNMVQMVMMHELAHNTHMNHGRDFWKTRNLYVEELKSLWQRGYTGEGFWGSGRALSDLSVVMSGNNVLMSEELARLPLCGGTFRSRRTTRKRKRGAGQGGEELTWKEKRDRQIQKKFGKNGVALGEDESKRLALDYNHAKMKTTKGVAKGVSLGLTKPRVAQSKRGRELRAAAALARFETNKKEVEVLEQQNTKKDEDEEEEDDDEEEGDEDGDDLEEDAVDLDGSKLLDSQGQGMVRVCDHEDAGHDVDAQHELEEMNSLDRYFKPVIQRRQQKQEQEQQQKRPASDQTRSNGDDYVKGKIGLLSNDAAERPTSPDLDQSRNEQDSFGMDTNTSVQRPTTSVTTTPEPEHDVSSELDTRPPRVVSHESSSSAANSTTTTSTTSRRIRTGTRSLDTTGSKPETELTAPEQEDEAEPRAQTLSAPAPATVSLSPTIPTATTTGIASLSHTPTPSVPGSTTTSTTISCPICSLDNPRLNAICIACSHVLDPQKDPRHWVCQTESCRNTLYRNPGDAGLCGICGERRR